MSFLVVYTKFIIPSSSEPNIYHVIKCYTGPPRSRIAVSCEEYSPRVKTKLNMAEAIKKKTVNVRKGHRIYVKKVISGIEELNKEDLNPRYNREN